jgi:hypothetical protein
MDTAATITLVIGFALYPVALFWVFKEAGSIANKFAISFSVATILSLLPIVLMATSEEMAINAAAPIGNLGIPPYLLIFVAELVFFIVHSFRSQARELQRNINTAAQNLEKVSLEISDNEKIVKEINDNITNRYLELDEVRKTPR